MSKETQTEQHQSIIWQGVALIIAAVIGIMVFTAQIMGNCSEIDTKHIGDLMHNAADEMSQIQSKAGTTINEAYYDAHGTYLIGESKIHNADMWFQKRQAIAIDVIGMLFCVVMIVTGTRMTKSKTTNS